jgi:thiamine biosynthesis lipoprotein
MPSPVPEPEVLVSELELETRAMGGSLHLLVSCPPGAADQAEVELRRVADRIDAWAQRLSRFEATSDLSALNDDPTASEVPLRPTIAAVLSLARDMGLRTEGTVDVAMLDERIAAETGARSSRLEQRPWRLTGGGRRRTLVRSTRARFDLDGVAKGWIADRALGSLDRYEGALVDADGDIAMRAPRSLGWVVAVGDPFSDARDLATLRMPESWRTDRLGVATSGTTVHRWGSPAGPTHHLIDPRTGRPAATDVVQATVVAESAAAAECLAKSAVVRGSHRGLELVERAGAWAAVLLLEDGSLVTTPRTAAWLA